MAEEKNKKSETKQRKPTDYTGHDTVTTCVSTDQSKKVKKFI